MSRLIFFDDADKLLLMAEIDFELSPEDDVGLVADDGVSHLQWMSSGDFFSS